MQLKKFETYADYVEVQRRTDRRKTGKPGLRQSEVEEIAAHLRHSGVPVSKVMCHGARYGQEVDWFSTAFPDAKVWGTDLFDKGHPKVLLHDFHKHVRRWTEAFDVVYSNSLDHARDPSNVLKTWLGQLRPTGRLCIQWNHHCRSVCQGDCFGADLHEYVFLIMKHATVCTVLHHYRAVFTIVARRK